MPGPPAEGFSKIHCTYFLEKIDALNGTPFNVAILLHHPPGSAAGGRWYIYTDKGLVTQDQRGEFTGRPLRYFKEEDRAKIAEICEHHPNPGSPQDWTSEILLELGKRQLAKEMP